MIFAGPRASTVWRGGGASRVMATWRDAGVATRGDQVGLGGIRHRAADAAIGTHAVHGHGHVTAFGDLTQHIGGVIAQIPAGDGGHVRDCSTLRTS